VVPRRHERHTDGRNSCESPGTKHVWDRVAWVENVALSLLRDSCPNRAENYIRIRIFPPRFRRGSNGGFSNAATRTTVRIKIFSGTHARSICGQNDFTTPILPGRLFISIRAARSFRRGAPPGAGPRSAIPTHAMPFYRPDETSGRVGPISGDFFCGRSRRHSRNPRTQYLNSQYGSLQSRTRSHNTEMRSVETAVQSRETRIALLHGR
jgi:hypothetical protein